MREVPVPVRLGLVETQAAKHMARFGYYPEAYMVMVRMYCGGIVPPRVSDLANRIRAEWRHVEIPNPHPGMVRIHLGPHSFLVRTSEVLPPRDGSTCADVTPRGSP